MLMNPAFPDLVAEQAACGIANDVHPRETRPRRFDPSLLAAVEARSIDEMVDVLIMAAAEQEIAETRLW